MKKIIRWLADISGVTKQIEKEVRYQAGTRLMESSHWYGDKERVKSGNALWFYGIYLRNNYFSYPDDFLRTKLDCYDSSIHSIEGEIKTFLKLSTLK